MKSKIVQILVALAVVVAVVLLLGSIKFMQFSAMAEAGKAFVPPAEAVTTASVQHVRWRNTIEAVGTVVASQGVTVSSEVPGMVREIYFESGETVERGEVLVRLNASTEFAQIASARSSAELASQDFDRVERLRQNGANSAADFDSAASRRHQATASLRSLRSAANKKVIRAPFAGRLGIRQVNLGQVVDPGTPLVSLQAVTPIYVDFSVPQQSFAQIAVGNEVKATVGAGGEDYTGVVESVDAEVDPQTRSIRIRARFGNEDERLVPGMFVDISVQLEKIIDTLAIPSAGVLFAPYGDSVFVVREEDGNKTVSQRFIRLGERRGDLVAVVSGLEPSDVVVSSGAFKLQNGMVVTERNDLAPETSEHPTPGNQ